MGLIVLIYLGEMMVVLDTTKDGYWRSILRHGGVRVEVLYVLVG